MIEITQADRKAAEEWKTPGTSAFNALAKDFARHRMEATEALITESEMLREALDKLTEASSKMLTEAISRGNALDALEAENARLRGKLVAISNMYPDWASERMALVRKRAREVLGDA